MVSFCCLVRSLNILHIRCDLGSIQVFLQSSITYCSGHYLLHLTLESLRCVESRKAFIWSMKFAAETNKDEGEHCLY
jgi:hypothetical protein